MKLFSLITLALLATPANADELRPFIAANSIGDPVAAGTLSTTTAPKPESALKRQEAYIGLGVHRSAHLVAFPFKHPVKAFNKGTYPVRHPLAAFKKFGEAMEPFQPALNASSALAGPATAVGVFVRH